MITFLLVNPEREISSIAMLVSHKGKKYKRSVGISVQVKKWNKTKKRVRVTADYSIGNSINNNLNTLESIALQVLDSIKRNATPPSRTEFFTEIDKLYFGEEYNKKKNSFFDLFTEFLSSKNISQTRINKYNVLKRDLQRFEALRKSTLIIAEITSETLKEFELFLISEHTFWHDVNGKMSPLPRYEYIYKIYPESRTPAPRGTNTIATITKMLRCFMNWCLLNKHISTSPFIGYEAKQEVYGTPFYISIEERNHIYKYDLSSRPKLAIQRDIFVFQCLVGCRISDLYNLSSDNISDDILEYIPQKTITERTDTIRVPLNDTAKDIVNKYKGGEQVLPFIAKVNYNVAIKEIFNICGLTRLITIMNSRTGKEEQKRLCDIASSHLARRTFIGNIYKQVKDPNLVGSLSGHKEGSRAFARYRNIDDDIKKDLIKLLD
ncbi:MAG: integrase catalytic domain-containing protein [Bacteroidetes bacterium]|nr:integrase catalytic domain-containing protein [Bacteroidota bacterium]